MDGVALRWRALSWGGYWIALVLLTFGWSAGVGLAIQSTVYSTDFGGCIPISVLPLIASPHDALTLPVRALVAAPVGLYHSGLQFGFFTAFVLLLPAALLEYGTAKRVFGIPLVVIAALAFAAAAWSVQLAMIFQHVDAQCLRPYGP
ncbi:MAG: hypothetical protein JOZ86_12205 [Candidatus Eremiobacteraeota bacterium]|nr:hypothetical protein [Candidatus Eremiobacteraeota bacterium]